MSEDSGNGGLAPLGWVLAGAALGAAAFALLSRRRTGAASVGADAESLLAAAERAAARLDEILGLDSSWKEAV